MIEEHGVSERQACKALSVPRSSYHNSPKPKNDVPVINELQLLVGKHPCHWFLAVVFSNQAQGIIMEPQTGLQGVYRTPT